MDASGHIARLALGAVLLTGVSGGCGDQTTLDPGTPEMKGAPTGSTTGPGVKSADPDSAPRNTRLTVRVLGTGFDQGSRAVWALSGDTTAATTKIHTNSTTFVSSTEIRADITIGADAPLLRYDVVVVTSRGKKGIGIELFTVTYERVDLGTLGGTTSEAFSINDNGQITGVSTTASGEQHVFVWSGGSMQDLGPGWASGINASGQVVGYIGSRAVVWTPRSGGGYDPPLDLGTLGGPSSFGRAINDAGQITGESTTPGGLAHAFLRSGGIMTDIQTIVGGESFPWGMNNNGQVAGQWNGSTNQSFLYTPGTGMRLLPTLGGTHGVALDVNDNGQVVGWSDPAPGKPDEAYIYENGAIRALGTLGAPGSVAIAINRNGQAAGRASVPAGRRSSQQHPFYWTATVGMKDLGVPKGMNFGMAWDINASGSIVGEVSGNTGSSRATLWRLH